MARWVSRGFARWVSRGGGVMAWAAATNSHIAFWRLHSQWRHRQSISQSLAPHSLYLASQPLSREKLMPLSKMLGSQAETRLWALEMVPKGFWCDDKAYPSKKQMLHMTKQQLKPNEKHVTILNQYINVPGLIVQINPLVNTVLSLAVG